MYQSIPQDARFYVLIERYDLDIARLAREGGCPLCDGVLHAARFPRKPRGGPADLGPVCSVRESFCCEREGCRRRQTPPSLRFLGRKVFLAAAVVVVSAMRHGATPKKLRQLREMFGVSRRTVARWAEWWRTVFVASPLWRVASGSLIPPVAIGRLPASLLERFAGSEQARLVALLRLLGPITGGRVVHAR